MRVLPEVFNPKTFRPGVLEVRTRICEGALINLLN
jgi:hypothetical protein